MFLPPVKRKVFATQIQIELAVKVAYFVIPTVVGLYLKHQPFAVCVDNTLWQLFFSRPAAYICKRHAMLTVRRIIGKAERGKSICNGLTLMVMALVKGVQRRFFTVTHSSETAKNKRRRFFQSKRFIADIRVCGLHCTTIVRPESKCCHRLQIVGTLCDDKFISVKPMRHIAELCALRRTNHFCAKVTILVFSAYLCLDKRKAVYCGFSARIDA